GGGHGPGGGLDAAVPGGAAGVWPAAALRGSLAGRGPAGRAAGGSPRLPGAGRGTSRRQRGEPAGLPGAGAGLPALRLRAAGAGLRARGGGGDCALAGGRGGLCGGPCGTVGSPLLRQRHGGGADGLLRRGAVADEGAAGGAGRRARRAFLGRSRPVKEDTMSEMIPKERIPKVELTRRQFLKASAATAAVAAVGERLVDEAAPDALKKATGLQSSAGTEWKAGYCSGCHQPTCAIK